jgi:hypothetical protein
LIANPARLRSVPSARRVLLKGLLALKEAQARTQLSLLEAEDVEGADLVEVEVGEAAAEVADGPEARAERVLQEPALLVAAPASKKTLRIQATIAKVNQRARRARKTRHLKRLKTRMSLWTNHLIRKMIRTSRWINSLPKVINPSK